MSRNVKGAQRSAAQAMISGKGAPDGLDSFLGGFASGGAGTSPEEEGMIAVNLKLLTKNSDITKQKALTDLIQRIPSAGDDVVCQFVSGFAEAVIRHVHYVNPAIRRAMFAMLKVLLGKGKNVKMALVADLPALSPVWVMGMNDMELVVRTEAREAFETAFSAEKRPAMLLKYKDNIVDGLVEVIREIVEVDGSPLTDDTLDKRSNAVYSALCGLGFMAKQVSAAQSAVVAFLDSPVFLRLLPSRNPEKRYIAAKTPLVRSACLSLLRDVISVCPCTPKLHQRVSTAVDGAILDDDATMAARVWELLLFWCRGGPSDVISYLPQGFLDSVIDSFMNCHRPELADVIFPSLFPFLTQLTKDPRCSNMLDEFCGAIVEKVRVLKDTPNVSAQELAVILQALLECWELHCVRKKGTDDASDSEELFCVIVINLSELMENPAKRQRFRSVAVSTLAKSLMKTSTRNEVAFKSCLLILGDLPGAPFKVLPPEPSPETIKSFHFIRGAALGAMYTIASRDSAYNRLLPSLTVQVSAVVEQQVSQDDAAGLAALLHYAEGNLKPSQLIADTVVSYLLHTIPKLSKEEGDDEGHRECKEILAAALSWDVSDASERLMALAEEHHISYVRETLKDHLLKDPMKAFDMLVTACGGNAFDDIERCVGQLIDTGVSLTTEQQDTLLQAVVEALEDALQLVTEQHSDDEESGSSAESGSDSSDDDDGSSSESEGEDSEQEGEDEEDAKNEGAEVLGRVAEWCELLAKRKPLAVLLSLTADTVERRLGMILCKLTAAIAPRVYPEHYISMKALRVALQDESDVLVEVMGLKVHALKVDNFDLLIQGVEALFQSYEVPPSALDKLSWELYQSVLTLDAPLGFLGAHQMQQIVPYASPELLCRLVSDAQVWDSVAIRSAAPMDKSTLRTNFLSLFDGYFSLSQIKVSMFTVVRSAQLVRLMDSLRSTTEAAVIPAVPLFFRLIRTAAAKEALPAGIVHTLFHEIIPATYARINDAESAKELVSLILDKNDPHDELLLCTMAAVLRDTAKILDPADHAEFVLRTRRVVSAVTERAVRELFTQEGARGIAANKAIIYATFFTLMDESADVVRDNMLGKLPKDLEALFLEASCMLPTWDPVTAKLALVIHRHLSTMPVVAESTSKSIVEYAQKQNPLDGLEILAELSCTRVLSLPAFSEIVRVLTHSLCRCYTLQHLPSNGRLQTAQPNRPAAPLSFDHLRRICVAAVWARRGVIIHSRMDDVLRSTVNLVIFDSVCEAVSRLRSTKGDDVPLLAQLVAFSSSFMSELFTNDIAVLRASEASVVKIASVMCFAYLWVSASSIAKLDAIGIETVASVLRSVCLLANLTLMRSNTPLHEAMRPIMGKISLKPLREEFSSAAPLKLAQLRRFNSLIDKTHKQKLLLFPYLLSWSVYLTTPMSEEETSAASMTVVQKAWRLEVYQLLDLVCALLLSPQFPNTKRVDDTFLGSALSPTSPGAPAAMSMGSLGFEVVALTRTTADHSMAQLSRGAAAVFSLLLQGPTLTFVKSWMETLERKTQAMLFAFVEMHISPTLIQENILTVLSHSADGKDTFNVSENVTINVSSAQRRIDLQYEMEDAKVSVRIVLPTTYPLNVPTVEHSSGRDCGVSTERWRSWMLKMTSMLFSGGANIWNCIELFGRNMDAHLGGQEPCPICFAVVNIVNHKLPEMRCSVCQNSSFHSNCLYTWWANGGQTVCPLCRSPWISE